MPDLHGFNPARPGAILAAMALCTVCAAPAYAQFGGLGLPSIPVPSKSTSSDAKSSDGCPKGKSKSAGSSILGGFLGRAVNKAAGSAGISSWVPTADVADQLTNAIACRLDPEEQKQAADATLEATRGEAVGSSASWTSQTRQNVSGTSTVTARNDDRATGMKCIMVTDVIIVNGEETTANKKMCKPPGGARYSLMA